MREASPRSQRRSCKSQEGYKIESAMKLLLFVLPGHVCLISLGVANLVEVISDDLNDVLSGSIMLRSHGL